MHYKDNCSQTRRKRVIAANTDMILEGNEKQTETRDGGTARVLQRDRLRKTANTEEQVMMLMIKAL